MRLSYHGGMQLELPTLQNWSCHNCSGCCRQHLIEVTEEERQRIIDQNWSAEDGIPADRPVLVPFGPPWKKRYRLGHQPDGACVFLDEKGLCRIHAKHGEDAKPLPCRIYPYAFHPSRKGVVVSLRFSCPSVVRNQGRPLSQQSRELKEYAKAVVPEGVNTLPPPAISNAARVDWRDFQRFVDALDRTIAEEDQPLVVKLLRSLFWINLVEQASFDQVKGERLSEFLELITEAAAGEIAAESVEPSEPSGLGATQFRMLVAQYARKDTLVAAESGLMGRIKLLRAATRFARGRGNIPPLQSEFKEVPFAKLEQPFGGLSEEADEILTRYFRVKIQGLHFCGRACFDWPLVEGYRGLVLVYPSVLWLARWLSAGDNRTKLQTDDVARALAIADHSHAYSPALGTPAARRRVRTLASTGDIEKLCAWYTQ